MSWDPGGSFAKGSSLDSLVPVVSGLVSEASSWTDMVATTLGGLRLPDMSY